MYCLRVLMMLAPLASSGCAAQPWSSEPGFSMPALSPVHASTTDASGQSTPAAPPWSPLPSAPQGDNPAARALAFAQARLGTPYCRGGTGPGCFDCSGFTLAAWRAAGRTIPRTSTQQVSGLPPVPMDRLQPGDIVWKPGHVALYLGNGKVINATKPGDVVKIQPLKGFTRAVRPH